MNKVINTVRWIFAGLLGIILCVIVTVTPLLISTSLVVTNRDSIKGWVDQSGLYNQLDQIVISALKDQLNNPNSLDEQKGSTDKNPLSEGEIEQLIKDTLTPDFAKNVVESAVDGFYNYVDGTTEEISIKVDKKEIQNAFLNILIATSGYKVDSIDQLTELPTCTTKQEKKLQSAPEGTTLTCIPKEIDFDKIFEDTASQSGLKIADDGTIDITPPEFNNPSETTFPVQLFYTSLIYLPFILVGIILLLSLILVILVPGWKPGLIFTGIVGIIGSLAILTISLIAYFGGTITSLSMYYPTDIPAGALDIIKKLSELILHDFFGKTLVIGTISLILFILVALSSLLIKSSQKQTKDIPH